MSNCTPVNVLVVTGTSGAGKVLNCCWLGPNATGPPTTPGNAKGSCAVDRLIAPKLWAGCV